jgi:2-keto-4-pentenoate hydratase
VAGATRVGWKIGRGIEKGQEQLEPVVGYLTSSTLVEPGGVFSAAGAGSLRVDAEVAIEVGSADVGAALEFVDVVRPPHDFETIVARNIWHRGVAFGPLSDDAHPARFEARVVVNGSVRASKESSVDVDETVAIAERLLAAIGEQLQPRDRIIAGSILHVPVGAGDDIVVDLGPLGRVGAKIR